jgi:hypothetical protein
VVAELVLVLILMFGMSEIGKLKWILKESKLPWLKLDIEFPYEEMLEEAKAYKDRFVKHRAEDQIHGYKHFGWSSLCLHGISSTHTNHYESYGFKSNDETPYRWTELSSLCYKTTKWLTEVYPCDIYYRVRFMLLEPGGFIAPHADTLDHKLSPVNIALNHPKGCIMKMAGYGTVPFKEGEAYILDVGNTHAYYNKSNQDRYHIIVHGNYKSNNKWKELIENSYKKNGIK